MADPICAVDGCEKATCKRGYCNAHYRRLMRHGDPLGGRRANGETQAWLKATAATEADECQPWPFAMNSNGYGHMTHKGRTAYPHRVMVEMTTGKPIPKGMDVLHSCDFRACANPRHLSIGTRKDNMQDAVQKGRQAKGRQIGGRFTRREARDIYLLCRDGYLTRSQIAEYFGVKPSTISNVCAGRTYVWATQDLHASPPHSRTGS